MLYNLTERELGLKSSSGHFERRSIRLEANVVAQASFRHSP